MASGVPLEPYMSQGDQGVAETPIVAKGLNLTLHFRRDEIVPNLTLFLSTAIPLF